MRILFRYVFREFCVPLAYCLTGFMSIYVLFELFGVFSRIMEAQLGWRVVVLYFAAYLSPYFEWLAPACLMLAALYTMWRFCRHSELIAMRASGVGFVAIARPMLVVAMAMAVFVLWVNECFVPRHAQWAKQLRTARFDRARMQEVDGIVYHNVKALRTWNVGAAMNPEATALEEVSVSEDWPEGGRRRTVKAARAECLDGEWWLYRPAVLHFGRTGEDVPSPTPALDELDFRAFPEFDERPRDFVIQNRDPEYYSTADRLRFLATHPNMSEKFRREMEYDLWAQLAAPFACIVITLFAIPAGVATGRQSVFRGVLGALAMFFAFYALTIGCLVLARLGALPAPVAALLPDVVFLGIGSYLFYRQR